MKTRWILSGAAVASLASLSIAFGSVPKNSRITDDTAIYQNLSEIRVPREASPDFDSDISKLKGMEGRYREKLPTIAQNPRLRNPIQRINQRRYRFSGKKTASNSSGQKKTVRE